MVVDGKIYNTGKVYILYMVFGCLSNYFSDVQINQVIGTWWFCRFYNKIKILILSFEYRTAACVIVYVFDTIFEPKKMNYGLWVRFCCYIRRENIMFQHCRNVLEICTFLQFLLISNGVLKRKRALSSEHWHLHITLSTFDDAM